MNAAVILQKCSRTGKTFGIRVQQMDDGEWYRTWAFPMDEARAGREGYSGTKLNSMLPETPEYPGCPYCGSKGFFYDYNCEKSAAITGIPTSPVPGAAGTMTSALRTKSWISAAATCKAAGKERL